jgi:thiamine biosynthesis lipoprotein ApbE
VIGEKSELRTKVLGKACHLVVANVSGDGQNHLDIALAELQRLGNRTTITRLKLNQMGYSIKGSFENTLKFGNEVFSKALSPIDGQPVPGLLSVAVVAESCLDACSAACIARLKTEAAAIKWLDGLGLKWIAINRQMQCLGPLAPTT